MDLEDDRSSLYTVLNVPNDASTEEIRKAYRRLAQSLHPDKHQDESLQEQAKVEFRKI